MPNLPARSYSEADILTVICRMGSCLSQGQFDKSITINLNQLPDPQDCELHAKITDLLSRGPELLQNVSNYQSCEDYVKKAVSDPSPQTENEAWNALDVAANQLHSFYEFAIKLEKIFPELLVAFCIPNQSVHQMILKHQALVNLLIEIFSYAIKFDKIKMNNSAIQNDFSYYRRLLSRKKTSGVKTFRRNARINEEVANKMSFHFAYPAPVMRVLTNNFYTEGVHVEAINLILLGLAYVSCQEVESVHVADDVKLKFTYLLTGCVILIDYSNPYGSFKKHSPLDIKRVLSNIKKHSKDDKDTFFNEIRFASLHLKDKNVYPFVHKTLDVNFEQ